jgi:hypothetical protein
MPDDNCSTSGHADCSDSSDEELCQDEVGREFSSFPFHKDFTCLSGYRCQQLRDDQPSQCISLTELCDGTQHCPMADDEHFLRCSNVTCDHCNTISGQCQWIHRIPVCQCRSGYVTAANGFDRLGIVFYHELCFSFV